MRGPTGPGAAASAFATLMAVLGCLVASLRGIRHFRCFANAALGSLRRLTMKAAAMSAVTVMPAAGTSRLVEELALAAAGMGAGGAAGKAAGPRSVVISTTSAKMTVP